MGLARHTMGIGLLLSVVVLWTTSSFLASDVLSNATFSKPFFMTYFNTAFFVLPLFPIIGKEIIYLWRSERLTEGTSLSELLDILDSHLQTSGKQVADVEGQPQMVQSGPHTPLLARECSSLDLAAPGTNAEKLGLKATAKIAFEFCILWFSANYFAFACLQHTTVSSTTILTSTSGKLNAHPFVRHAHPLTPVFQGFGRLSSA
ncbi:hypothetical protein KEM55_002763 [Ascosphaera atra]|nr:hypothetical protein KEM55_002763 [Ascosphaera atra]